jgi:Ca2+-binding EF-hand superfamily protein
MFNKHFIFLYLFREIGTIMRALGAFPSDEDLVTTILPELNREDNHEYNQVSGTVTIDRFELYMLRVILEHLYEPDSEEVVLRAFRVLDPENKGYINEATMRELLTSNEWAFKEKELEDFMRVAKDPDTNYIHYEDYVTLLSN